MIKRYARNILDQSYQYLPASYLAQMSNAWIFYGACKLSFVWHFAFPLFQSNLLIPAGDLLFVFLWTNLSPQSCGQKGKKKGLQLFLQTQHVACDAPSELVRKNDWGTCSRRERDHTIADKHWSFGGITHHSIYRSFFLLRVGLWLALTSSHYGPLNFYNFIFLDI